MNMMIWRREPDEDKYPEGAFYIQVKIGEEKALCWEILGKHITDGTYREIERKVKEEQEKEL